jgi:hypothetical protein
VALEFSQTNWLRTISLILLCVGDMFLLYDDWLSFFICVFLAGFFEWNRAQIYRMLTHHHFASIERKKKEERDRQTRLLEELRKKSSQQS